MDKLKDIFLQKMLAFSFILILLVFLPTILYFWGKYDFLTLLGITKDASTIQQWGTVGDYFGGILNPSIAFLALVMLIETYKLQKEELEKTREVLYKQSTDGTFFELFKILLSRAENTVFTGHSIKIGGKAGFGVEEQSYTGMNAFKHIWNTLKTQTEREPKLNDIDSTVGEIYYSIVEHTGDCTNLNDYLSLFFQLIRYIDRMSSCSNDYLFFLKNSLSNEQQLILFYFGVYHKTQYSENIYIMLIEKFSLLQGIEQNILLFEQELGLPEQSLINLYSRKAFFPDTE